MKPSKSASMLQLGCRITILALFLITPTTTLAQTTTLGEAVDNTSLTWITGGTANWFGQTSVYYYDGDAAQSGAPANNQSSWIQTTVNGPGFLTFYWKVASGAQLDLDFYVDSTKQAECSSTSWQLKGYSIPSGSHTLRWDYTPFIQSSGDAGYLDKVTFNPGSAVVVDVPNGGETLTQREFYTIRWVNSADVTNVRIALYKGGALLRTIAASTPGDGNYNWFVPPGLEPAADYRLRVASLANPANWDESDGDFSIAAASQPALNGALVLDGVDDYAEAADQSELDLAGGSFTVEAWVNLQNLGGVFLKPGAYGLHVESQYTYPSWRHCMGIDYPCSVTECTSSRYLSLGWHHIALVYDATAQQARAYYDGVQRASASCSAENSDQPLRVGKGFAGSLEGAVDEMRISRVARYTSNFTPPTGLFSCDGNTRALWHLDEFEGTTMFHDICGAADNLFIGYNGAHTEGRPGRQVYLPLVLRQCCV